MRQNEASITDEMVDRAHVILFPLDDRSEDWGNRREWWRWQDVRRALEAALWGRNEA